MKLFEPKLVLAAPFAFQLVPIAASFSPLLPESASASPSPSPSASPFPARSIVLSYARALAAFQAPLVFVTLAAVFLRVPFVFGTLVFAAFRTQVRFSVAEPLRMRAHVSPESSALCQT